jgi:hypothetical protein
LNLEIFIFSKYIKSLSELSYKQKCLKVQQI